MDGIAQVDRHVWARGWLDRRWQKDGSDYGRGRDDPGQAYQAREGRESLHSLDVDGELVKVTVVQSRMGESSGEREMIIRKNDESIY